MGEAPCQQSAPGTVNGPRAFCSASSDCIPIAWGPHTVRASLPCAHPLGHISQCAGAGAECVYQLVGALQDALSAMDPGCSGQPGTAQLVARHSVAGTALAEAAALEDGTRAEALGGEGQGLRHVLLRLDHMRNR